MVPLFIKTAVVVGFVPAIGRTQPLLISMSYWVPLEIVTEFQVTVPQVKVSSPVDEDKVRSIPLGSKFPVLLRLSATLSVVTPAGKVPALRVITPLENVIEVPVIVSTAPVLDI